MGCYLTNGTEYLETLLACFKLRAVPVNINYRYVDRRVALPVQRRRPRGRGVPASSSGPEWPRSPATCRRCATPWWWPTTRGSTRSLDRVPGGTDYDAALAAAARRPPGGGRPRRRRPLRDLHRRHHRHAQGRGVAHGRRVLRLHRRRRPHAPERPGGVAGGDASSRIIDFDFVFYALAPLMHAAAQWVSFMWLLVRRPRWCCTPGRFDPEVVWRTIEAREGLHHHRGGRRHGPAAVRRLGRARPLRHLARLFAFSNGGAPLTPGTKARLQSMLPSVVLTDGFGSSETGIQGSQRLEPGGGRRLRAPGSTT